MDKLSHIERRERERERVSKRSVYFHPYQETCRKVLGLADAKLSVLMESFQGRPFDMDGC